MHQTITSLSKRCENIAYIVQCVLVDWVVFNVKVKLCLFHDSEHGSQWQASRSQLILEQVVMTLLSTQAHYAVNFWIKLQKLSAKIKHSKAPTHLEHRLWQAPSEKPLYERRLFFNCRTGQTHRQRVTITIARLQVLRCPNALHLSIDHDGQTGAQRFTLFHTAHQASQLASHTICIFKRQ